MPILTIVSSHVYSNMGRKASIHFLADAFCRMGYTVNFVTVGRGPIFAVRNKYYRNVIRKFGVNNWALVDGISSIITNEFVEVINLRYRFINSLYSNFLKWNGFSIPDVARQSVQDADLIIIDSGISILFCDSIRILNSGAPIIYNAADIMACVGAHPILSQAEAHVALTANVTRIPSPFMKNMLPEGSRCIVVPHGLEKAAFDICSRSPYPDGTINIVSVGNTLHDSESFQIFCDLMRDNIFFHIFGAFNIERSNSNIRLYGERPFSDIIPFLKFANAGIAAYFVSDKTAYMADSSLKMIQYKYCNIPVFAPNTINWSYKRIIKYAPGDMESIRKGLVRFLEGDVPDGGLVSTIPTWDDVAQMILTHI